VQTAHRLDNGNLTDRVARTSISPASCSRTVRYGPLIADLAALARHVASAEPDESGRMSTFNLALRDARQLVGRDVNTGRPTTSDEGPVSLWGGSIIYLVLLEQIGKSLRPVGGRPLRTRKERALETAIRQFAPKATSETERQVLYALRCAFAHEFGLMNHGKPPYRRVFRLYPYGLGRVVERAPKPWTGDPADASERTSTRVDLALLADLAEDVVAGVRRRAQKGELRSVVSIVELERRFAISVEVTA
jgi:hypothetical protein